MDTLQHAAWGYVIARVAEQSFGLGHVPALEISSAVVGALPDVLGAVEAIVVRRSPWSAHRPWRWYNVFHGNHLDEAPRWMGAVVTCLMLLPPYAVHVLMDRPTHGVPLRWWRWDEGLFIEVLGWFGVACAAGGLL